MDWLSTLLWLLSADDPIGIVAAFVGAFIGAAIIRYAIRHHWRQRLVQWWRSRKAEPKKFKIEKADIRRR